MVKFLPKLSSTLAPLYKLLEKKEKWMWGKPQEEAWQAIKKQLTAAYLLTHFDPDKRLSLHVMLTHMAVMLSSHTGQRKDKNQ